MMNSTVIHTEGLFYEYAPGVGTVADINLQVHRGDIYGFLGPNGSGKTTTLSLLLGLLRQQRGEIEILGKNLRHQRREVLQKVGSLIEGPSVYGHLTARENLAVYREIYGVSKAWLLEVLKIVGLGDAGSKMVRQFSLGMKQRLALGLALLPCPELLILDEPTNGLDPGGILELRQLIQRLVREGGITIVVSSHMLSEVEKMVNRVGIICKGRMRYQGSLEQLQGAEERSTLETIFLNLTTESL